MRDILFTFLHSFNFRCYFLKLDSSLQAKLKCQVFLLFILDGSPVIVFLFVYVTSSCDVGQNYDGICKIASLVSCFLVDSSASGILNQGRIQDSKLGGTSNNRGERSEARNFWGISCEKS